LQDGRPWEVFTELKDSNLISKEDLLNNTINLWKEFSECGWEKFAIKCELDGY
tara:strand:- start:774 stop:932 length:159 start_codon:yes stop_codon:yes gene_type:complete